MQYNPKLMFRLNILSHNYINKLISFRQFSIKLYFPSFSLFTISFLFRSQFYVHSNTSLVFSHSDCIQTPKISLHVVLGSNNYSWINLIHANPFTIIFPIHPKLSFTYNKYMGFFLQTKSHHYPNSGISNTNEEFIN